jgi:hypothetical protein
MIINDYEAQIFIGSNELVDWSGFSTTVRQGEAETLFSIDLRRPMNINIGDTATIKERFGDDPFVKLIDNKLIEGNTGSFRQINISGAGSDLSRKAPVKDIIFVNQSWLRLMAPGYSLYNTGASAEGYPSNIIMQFKPPGTPIQKEGVSIARLMLEGLPGKETRDTEFSCVVQGGITHQDIGRYLAQMLGYTLYVNTPNPPVQKTYSVRAGETYWRSLANLFALWRPMMFIRGTTIYVLDIGIDRQAKNGSDTIALTEDSFSVYNWNIRKNVAPIDHVVITGPDRQYTYISRNQNVSKREYTAIELPGATVTYHFEEKEEYTGADELEKTLYSKGSQDRTTKVVRVVTKKEDYNNPENVATISENIKKYNPEDVLLSESQADYKWASFKKPTKCTIVTNQRIGKVAGGTTDTWEDAKQTLPADYEWKKISEVETVYRDYYEEIGEVETDVTEFCLHVAYKDKEKHDGQNVDVYDPVKPLWQALQAGDPIYEENDDQGLGWMTAWQCYRRETIRFDKSSTYMYRKTRTQTTYYPMEVTKTSYEDIPIPAKKQRKEIHRRWEFFHTGDNAIIQYTGGPYPTGHWHPKVEITHSDIVTDYAAQQIAQRQMTANQLNITTISIETTIPLTNAFVGGTVHLPACTKEYLDYVTNTWVSVTIAAGTYWIVGVTRPVTYTGDLKNRGIDIKCQLELAEFF